MISRLKDLSNETKQSLEITKELASKALIEKQEQINLQLKKIATALGGLVVSVGITLGTHMYKDTNTSNPSLSLGTQISKTFEQKEVRQELKFDKAKVDGFKSGFLGGNNKNNVAIIDTIKNKFN